MSRDFWPARSAGRSEPTPDCGASRQARQDEPCESYAMDMLRTDHRPEELLLIRVALINARYALSVHGPTTLDFASEKAEIDAALMLIGFDVRATVRH